jgi:hypothetical protein
MKKLASMASRVTSALQATLREEEELAEYAERVQLVVDTPLKAFKAMDRPRFHCITLIRFLDCCVVIDLTAQATAFKVNFRSIYSFPGALSTLRVLCSC